jgi:HSP20 family protein
MMKAKPSEDLSAKNRARAPPPAPRTSFTPPPLLSERWFSDPYAWTSEFDRTFDEMRRNMESLVFPVWSQFGPRPLTALREVVQPRADFRDDGEAYSAVIELPGFAREHLVIEATPLRLDILAKREREAGTVPNDEGYIAHERNFKELQRTFEFPEAVLPDKISAELKEGVLTVRAPKERPTAASPRVRVKVG